MSKIVSKANEDRDQGSQQESYETTQQRLVNIVQQFSNVKVLVIGDIMLDEYLFGATERISPEAPVPIVVVEREQLLLGGAGNVAQNIKIMGGNVSLFGVCGEDRGGELLRRLLHSAQITHTLYENKLGVTTVKTRVLASRQQVVRIDREEFVKPESVPLDAVLRAIEPELKDTGAIIISDYGKGFVTKLFLEGLAHLLREQNRNIPILIDPKPKNKESYIHASLLTPNQSELGALAKMPVHSMEEIYKAGKTLKKELDLEHLLVTLGEKGMLAFDNDGDAWHIPTLAQKVFDVTGAGDTVISTLALALGAGASLLDGCLLANCAAGIVVGQVGAATVESKDLIQAISAKPVQVAQTLSF